ncbi:MAG: tRNA (adenosine(37)-N6)-threonylcarbamoyltransferase complex dimerization subunit type 1 TsaB [Clostridia bacterium]|nr:tRNA (adenosine(37)-N6)-threonylcarbamoyltransferase complex dimerization subunit type 1 TsaB [Clostridia bacterium]
MNILALDTSSITAGVALWRDGVPAAQLVVQNQRTHSRNLLPMVDAVLSFCDCTMDDIDLFAVGDGPGSFTGLRIGVATAKAFAHATNKPLLGVSILDGFAAFCCFPDGIICPLLDARRNQAYTAFYTTDASGKVVEKTPPKAMALEEILTALKGKKVLFTGDGLPAFEAQIREAMGEDARFAPPYLRVNAIGGIASLAVASPDRAGSYGALTPNYFRPSQAEREAKEKKEKRDL